MGRGRPPGLFLPPGAAYPLRPTYLPFSPMIQPQDIKRLIEAGLPGAQVEVTGDGHHFEALVVSEAFAGKTKIQQHQLVYRTLGDRMRGEIHALSMRTLTPEQWRQESR